MIENEGLLNQYNNEEIKQLLEDNIRLVYVDTGLEEFVARYEDLPDVIVDVDNKFKHSVDLKVYDFEEPDMDNPILTTFGCFLNKCQPKVREDIIDRLAKLQLGEEKIKDYKVINEDMLNDVQCSLDKDDEMER